MLEKIFLAINVELKQILLFLTELIYRHKT